jgi:hypothetical protein
MNWPSLAFRLVGRAELVVRPGCKTGTQRAVRRERAVIVRVGQAGSGGSTGGAGGGGRTAVKLTTIVVAIVVVAAAVADSREDILRTVRSVID